MASAGYGGNAGDPLAIGIRRIRRIAPPRSPVAATRAVLGGDDRVLLVDVEELTGWPGWRATGAQHLIAPIDLVRREDGHDAVIDDLRAPLGRICGEREGGAGWRRGEAVTLLVSLLRGVSEASERSIAEVAGEWWISSGGRPVFVFDGAAAPERTGDEATISDGAAALVARVAAACDDRLIRRIAEETRKALTEGARAVGRQMDRLEEALFDAAAPQAIDDGEATRGSPGGTPRVIEVSPEDLPEGRWAALREAISRHVDSRFAEVVSSALARLGGRSRPAADREGGRGRGRGLVIAAAVAVAVVLAVGLLWPGEPQVRAAPAVTPAPTPGSIGEPASVGGDRSGDLQTESAVPGSVPDPVRAARELFAAWDACGQACGGASADVERAGAIAAADREVRLVDDYGAIVLVAVTSPGAEPRLVVLERSEDEWRVREIYRGAPRGE